MSETTQYVDILNLPTSPDSGAVSLASKNYYEPDAPLVFPGRYYSPTRSIKARAHTPYGSDVVDPNNFDFVISFGKGGLLTTPEEAKIVYGAPSAFLDTVPKKAWRGVGEGSSAVRYLIACGFKGDFTSLELDVLKDMFFESMNRPVGVSIGWTDDRKERPEGAKPFYTSAFKVGEEEGKAVYSPRVELTDGSGRSITAVARVEGFFPAERFSPRS